MSWVVEQSENTYAVHVNGDTVTCTKDGYYGSPVNVMYKDLADRNGEYFWQVEFNELDTHGGGSPSVSVTVKQCFKAGWGLKAMQYLGNLADGSGCLVQGFGDQIKQYDKVGILLQLSDADLKMYIFHNERPLGLAFHIQSPYPKPLYPVVSFNTNGKAKISRSEQISSSLDRTPLQFTGVEGNWKIVDYPPHPECVGCLFEIKLKDQSQYAYDLYASVVNSLNCSLEHNPITNEWQTTGCISTLMGGAPEEMNKESVVNSLISGIQRLEVQGQEHLIIQTNSDEQVRLERYTRRAPSSVTKNIFT